VELKDVLLLGGAGDVRVGTPVVDGARVLAEVLEHGRDKKILVFKYKNKTRYRRRFGHRQDFTRLAIRQILTEGQQAIEATEKPKRPARKKVVKAAEAPTAEAVEAAPVEAAPAEATKAPKPRRPRAPKLKAETAPAPEAAPAPAEATEAPKPRRPRAPKPKAEEAPAPEAAPADEEEG
jgi:large subunit ribosomal protein L21